MNITRTMNILRPQKNEPQKAQNRSRGKAQHRHKTKTHGLQLVERTKPQSREVRRAADRDLELPEDSVSDCDLGLPKHNASDRDLPFPVQSADDFDLELPVHSAAAVMGFPTPQQAFRGVQSVRSPSSYQGVKLGFSARRPPRKPQLRVRRPLPLIERLWCDGAPMARLGTVQKSTSAHFQVAK